MKKPKVSVRHFVITWVVVVMVFPLLAPNNYVMHIANMIGIMSILTLSLNLLFGYTGQISLGHAAFFALGGYIPVLLEMHAEWLFLPATLIGVVVCLIVSVLVGIPTLRLKDHYLALATLGFNIIIQIVLNNWQGVTGGANGLTGISRPVFFGTSLTEGKYYYLIYFASILSFVFCHRLISSRFGRTLLAIRENEDAAASLGINVALTKNVVFAISAAMAGIAGSLYVHLNQYINPTNADLTFSISILVATVIGGLGSNFGALVGAFVMILLPEFLYGFKQYHMLVYGGIMAAIIVLLPQGVTGTFSNIFRLGEVRAGYSRCKVCLRKEVCGEYGERNVEA